MEKVVSISKFKEKKPEMVWSCGACDGQKFFISTRGVIICSRCEAEQAMPDGWVKIAIQVNTTGEVSDE